MASARPKQMEVYRYTGSAPVTVFHRTIYPGEVVDLWPGQTAQLEAQYPGLFVSTVQSAQVEAGAEANVETEVRAPVEAEAEAKPAAQAEKELKSDVATETKAESKPASTRRTSTGRKSTRSKQADGAEPEARESEDDA